MAPTDESTRRSARATKGQHTKNLDDASPPSKRQTKSKGKGGGSKSVKAASITPEEPSGGDEDAIIRCVCGATVDDAGWMMICCEKCDVWQHNLCMGWPEEEVEDDYYCEECAPQSHVELLTAMKRGEKPWLDRIKRKKKGGNKRKSRASAVAVETPVKETTPKQATPQEVGNKRKFEAVAESNGQRQVQLKTESAPEPAEMAKATPPAPKAGSRRKSSAVTDQKLSAVDESAAKRRKSAADHVQSEAPALAPTPVPVPVPAPALAPTSALAPTPAPALKVADINDLPQVRQSVAKKLVADGIKVIEDLVKDGTFRIPDGETSSSLMTNIALRIEQGLDDHFDGPSNYSNQLRMIVFNMKKNPELIHRMLVGTMRPEELVTMSSEDMATAEEQRKRSLIKEAADKHAILINNDGPRIRKTHKGEEVVEQEMAVDDSSYTAAPLRRRATHDEHNAPDSPNGDPGSPNMVELPEEFGSRPPLTVDTSASHGRKPSNFDMESVWRSAPAQDTSHSAGTVRTPHRAHRPSDNNMDDPDMDRLLKDEDMDDVSDSPITHGSGINWKGRVDMAGVAAFNASARWVAGANAGGLGISFEQLIPRKLEITGRIAINRADEYVGGMRYSQTTNVTTLALTPADTTTDHESFRKTFDYFHGKQRWGVINQPGLNEHVRDIYVVTLEAGMGNSPGFITMLEDREKSIEDPRQDNMLLLTIVVKVRSPPPSATPSADVSHPAAQVNAHAPQPSPVAAHGPFPNGGTPPVGNSWGPAAVQILGEFVHAPAVQQLKAAGVEMDQMQLTNLRALLEREPSARDDLGKLGDLLASRPQQ
ncbi:hypothetical protein BLS_003926 [Venturia inaequalis]|uniref:Transcription factor BYE1 n=1 Tax=Venturia inaequalis TaxID=5025 RepID=A0A8H3UAJ4_VENIN|nr:hypothetical protein EG328_009128 [Venturia inaequalis]KAE9972684.1 hypothetical protein BLS_003926 [Venturia inaequalis]